MNLSTLEVTASRRLKNKLAELSDKELVVVIADLSVDEIGFEDTCPVCGTETYSINSDKFELAFDCDCTEVVLQGKKDRIRRGNIEDYFDGL